MTERGNPLGNGATPGPAVETSDLYRAFGDVVAVDHLSLRVEAGSFFGFLGPNGAGKSTTIKMLTGLLHIGRGTARILGYDVQREPVRVKQLIGVVPEELALFDRLTGPEYLLFVGRMYGLPRQVIGERSDELLELMGLADEHKKLIVDYSHGMQKKLALCAALIHQPQLLFLDEPFEGIDAITSGLIKTLLGQLLASGVTIFLTSHILEIVERLCNEIAIINRGSLVAQGTLDQLREGIAVEANNGKPRSMTLEELFLTLVGGPGREQRSLSWLA